VSSEKKALILTDGTESIQSAAAAIADALTGYKTEVCPGETFAGTDILPAEIFFIGCEKTHPASFVYLAEMLAHINLADRSCGIFSTNEKTIVWLETIVKDCEASLGEPLLIDGEVKAPAVKKWVKGILK
jgi:hypothetical protein